MISLISSLQVHSNDKKQTDKTLFEQTLQKAERGCDRSYRTYLENSSTITFFAAFASMSGYGFKTINHTKHPMTRGFLGIVSFLCGLTSINAIIDRPAAKTRFEQRSLIYRELCKKLEPNSK